MKEVTPIHLLHALWTKARGTADYDKQEWMELERVILEHMKCPPPTPPAQTSR